MSKRVEAWGRENRIMTERAIVPIEQKTVLFYDDEIKAVRMEDGTVLVPIKPIIERLGLNWSGQYSRIRRDPVLSQVQGICVIQTPGGRQEAVSIPLDYLSGFLFGINADRVRPEFRDDVIRYQMECYKVLSEALSEGRLITDIAFDDLLQTADPNAVQAYQIAQAVLRLARNQIMLEARLTGRLDEHESRLVTLESTLASPGRLETQDQASQISQAVKAVALALGKASGRNEFGMANCIGSLASPPIKCCRPGDLKRP